MQIMLSYMQDGSDAKDDNKIVVLAHDRDFGAPLKSSGIDMAKAFDLFLKMAKEAGYVFRYVNLGERELENGLTVFCTLPCRKLADYPTDK